MNKKSNIIYLEKQTHSYLDIALNPVKISKNDILITDIKAKELLKYQLSIKKTDLTQISNIRDYLYAKCIQEGFFQSQKDYIFSYIIAEKSSELICHIYAKTQEITDKNAIKDGLHTQASFLIPDIFLPMALEEKYRESGLFLFENSLVFYYQGSFAYHTFITGQEDIDRALHYIQTIYSKISLLVWSAKKNLFHTEIPAYSLSEITSKAHPLAWLCFEYFKKQESQDLPILHRLDEHLFKKSKTFSMLLKIACVGALILLLPLGKIGYGFYINHQIKALQLQNSQILQSINNSSKNSTAVFEQTKTQNQLQNHLYSLQKIQTSYTPRYNIIAEISKRLAGKHIFVKNFYFTSDIIENIQVFELEIASKSEQNLIDFMQDLSNTPLISVDSKSIAQNEKIFSNGIFKSNQTLMTKIVWISNVL